MGSWWYTPVWKATRHFLIAHSKLKGAAWLIERTICRSTMQTLLKMIVFWLFSIPEIIAHPLPHTKGYFLWVHKQPTNQTYKSKIRYLATTEKIRGTEETPDKDEHSADGIVDAIINNANGDETDTVGFEDLVELIEENPQNASFDDFAAAINDKTETESFNRFDEAVSDASMETLDIVNIEDLTAKRAP